MQSLNQILEKQRETTTAVTAATAQRPRDDRAVGYLWRTHPRPRIRDVSGVALEHRAELLRSHQPERGRGLLERQQRARQALSLHQAVQRAVAGLAAEKEALQLAEEDPAHGLGAARAAVGKVDDVKLPAVAQRDERNQLRLLSSACDRGEMGAKGEVG